MEAQDLTVWYEYGFKSAMQINDWNDYQRLREPQPSRYPSPDGSEDGIYRQPRDRYGRFCAEDDEDEDEED